ncbi:MAG TPA: translesion error-prone DNA polymerase V autoproteolytic subunit [Flavisolibacter sp.]
MEPFNLTDLPVARAGFPSPANDYLDPDLDFNAYFRQHPSATFAMRVEGDCMADAHIPHGAMVIVDRAVKPGNHSIIIATVDGERMIKQLVRTAEGIFLVPANRKFKSIRIEEGMDFTVWGTVTHVVIDIFKPRI